ncbi:MAG: class I SAM-dependent methyltransferase [Candidatus Dojkabacteria bacterium]|nr:class I SAM-dependent methyltransferase [Candidatus Dojkabacteria bacterium]
MSPHHPSRHTPHSSSGSQPVRKQTDSPSKHAGRAPHRPRKTRQGWQRVSGWYDSLVGNTGSIFHRNVAIPIVSELLSVTNGERVLDLGCGQGALFSALKSKPVEYVGVDASSALITAARNRHPSGTFIRADVGRLPRSGIVDHSFDAVVFLFSIQDMPDLAKAIATAAQASKPDAKLVVFMTHPAFRIPRQSGWEFDQGRKLYYRRIDSYMSELSIPLRPHFRTKQPLTRSFHRPVGIYISELVRHGFHIDRFKEIPYHAPKNEKNSAMKRAEAEIPHFLALRARYRPIGDRS